ncbi:hypothetical protein CBR_g8216 [Chara braunii]|uniref:EF-hand domain-containing protein n=1 Tax=Chara braunii TaxID=69332 RepID=A0A388KLJ3_CHABU|nr:hypothetical protein CBR_g8216 [Chara braunii]|eukprot:GBG70915.1 hypothetical protein CBR_g8216 [Chara braunii]
MAHTRSFTALKKVFDSFDSEGNGQFKELVMTLYPDTARPTLDDFIRNEMKAKKKAQANKVNLNKQKLEEAKQLFAIYDKDGNGLLSLEEFKDAMMQAFTLDEAVDIFQHADQDHDGWISFDEFRAWYNESEDDRNDGEDIDLRDQPSEFVDNRHMGAATIEIAKRMTLDFKLHTPSSDVYRQTGGASSSSDFGSRPYHRKP